MPRRGPDLRTHALAAAPVLAGLLLAGLAGPAVADERDAAAPRGPEELLPGVESPELAALRATEAELAEQRGLLREPPPAWMARLRQPDLPVRWNERVARLVDFFRRNPAGRSLAGAWLRRLAHHGDLVRRRLRAQGLPEDLVYVAMVESGFDPTARSPAGAVGMWQFVAPTAREYGLRIDHWVDERMDMVASTDAAARYLGDLKRRLGSWELALAAYNMGYGALLRAITRYNTNDFWTLAGLEAGLPYETVQYVTRILAMAVVGHNADRFGFTGLRDIAPLRLARVEVPGGVSLAPLARAAGMAREELARLNASLRRGRTPPGEEAWPLWLPASRETPFRERWAKMRPQVPALRTYAVRFGETLRDVAHRFRTTVARLRRLNDIPRGEAQRIGLGTVLVVPDVEPREPDPEDRPLVPVPADVQPPEGRQRVFYRVVAGNTLREVARVFGVTVRELTQWNHVDPRARLVPGMVLQLFVPAETDLRRARVWREGDVEVLVVEGERFHERVQQLAGRRRVRHTVRPGETLSGIARRYGLRVADLARINRISPRARLREGQQLVVYVEEERGSGATGSSRRRSR